MDFLDLVQKRFSVRVYETKPVAAEAIDKVLEAARLAPSAANRQPLHLIVLHGGPHREAINMAYPRDWFRKPPVVVVVCVETAKAWVRSDGKNYADVDAAIALDHMALEAAELGLGSCWVAAFDPAKIKAILGLPDGIEPLAMLPIGYPAEGPREKLRKVHGDMVHVEQW